MKSNKKGKSVVSQNKLVWIIGGVVFIILAAGAVYLGTKNVETEPTIAPKIINKFEPEPTIATARLYTTIKPEPTLQQTPTEIEPSVVPEVKLTQKDLINFSNLELKKARNEIYARHGRAFVSQDMACYFAKQSWYQINPNYSEKLLSSLEVSNAVFILNYEKEINSPWVNKDSGCVE